MSEIDANKDTSMRYINLWNTTRQVIANDHEDAPVHIVELDEPVSETDVVAGTVWGDEDLGSMTIFETLIVVASPAELVRLGALIQSRGRQMEAHIERGPQL